MHQKNKAIFLDKDGIVIKMHYDIVFGTIDTSLSVKQIAFVPGIFEFLHAAKNLGYLLVLISNQPAVGIKKISLQTHKKMKAYIAKILQSHGITLDEEYYCLHHPYASISKYKKDCACRKPKTGFFTQAVRDHDIDLKQSWMIGDGVYDIIAGHNAGCKTILVGNIIEAEYLSILEKKLEGIKPDYLVKYISEAENLIKK
ncbi:MAG: HAD-IIIA family hydrolase [Candidatus Parcubacteria bacterium]|nr:HAD-IIIA family hydrolase [Candidatus Parcubacteria bacterium]